MATLFASGRLLHLKTRLIEKWKGDSPEKNIFRSMSMLASGTVLARVIAFATMPVITRIYSPADMGVLAVFTSLTAMLVPLGTLRYPSAIPLPRHEGLAVNLVMMCGLLLLFTSALSVLFFCFFSPFAFQLLSMNQLLPYWWLLPVAFASMGLYELLTSWAVREKMFIPIAKTIALQSASGAIVKIGLGMLGFQALGLLIGQIFSGAGGIFSLLKNLQYKLKANLRHVSGKRIWFLFKRYADFPKYRLLSQLLVVLSMQAPLLFFAWRFGAAPAGQLGLALTMIGLPMALFGQSTGQAYYAEIARIGKQSPGTIYQITKNVIRKLFLASIAPSLVLLLFGPWLFDVVFGAVWREAGVYTRILTLYLIAQFIYSPIANGIFNVFERQSMALMVNVSRVFLTLGVFLISYLISARPFLTLILYSVALTAQYVFAMIIVFKVINEKRSAY